MPKPKRGKTSPSFEQFLKSTDALFVGFGESAANLAAGFPAFVARVLSKGLATLWEKVRDALAAAYGVAGEAAQEALEEALDMFGAHTLVEDLGKLLEEATTPEDLAAIGSLLPLVKKILRFTFEILKVPLPVDFDRILEFMDELATGQIEQVSPKGAEQMHRAEIRYLEAQYHLDKLVGGRPTTIEDVDVKDA